MQLPPIVPGGARRRAADRGDAQAARDRVDRAGITTSGSGGDRGGRGGRVRIEFLRNSGRVRRFVCFLFFFFTRVLLVRKKSVFFRTDFEGGTLRKLKIHAWCVISMSQTVVFAFLPWKTLQEARHRHRWLGEFLGSIVFFVSVVLET